jgi:hypothetical protein
MDRPAGGRFGEVANEENAAAVKLRQAGETIEKRARFRSAIEVNGPETVPGIEDHEVGVGFLQRLPKPLDGLGLEVGEVNNICAGYGFVCIRGQRRWSVRRECIVHQGLL